MDEVPPILVVDDEPLVRLMVAEALEEGGYRVIEAENGPAALEQLEWAAELRALITDIRMGGDPDGWQLAHHARRKFPTLAVVYVTGDSITEWPANGVPQSVVLQKPFASAELVTAVANLLVAQNTGQAQQ
jgi:CheY-like chemotaxis protein